MSGLVSAPAVEETPKVTALEVFIDLPLYTTKQVDNDLLYTLRAKSYQFDAYCVWCHKECTFRHSTTFTSSVQPDWVTNVGKFEAKPKCTRIGHEYAFYFQVLTGARIIKIGQYPSIEDITGAEIRRYKNVLRDGYFQELTRANGLVSHGIGIGSFVYLRRIFEKLIQDHRQEHEALSGPIDGFDAMRMEDKIAALADVLPPALVKNRATYGILSTGIHALTEEQCKLYFPVVKAAILQILEQDSEARERKKREQELEEQVALINKQLRS